MPTSYSTLYVVVTTEHTGNVGGREAEVRNQTLSGWDCVLCHQNLDKIDRWNNPTHWITIGY